MATLQARLGNLITAIGVDIKALYAANATKANAIPFEATMAVLSAAAGAASASAAVGIEVLATTKMTRTLVDLSKSTQVRMTCMVMNVGNAPTAAIKLQYLTGADPTGVWAGGVDTGCSLVLGNGTAGQLRNSGWVNLPAGAKVDNVTVAAVVGVAFGTTAPTITTLSVQFR